MKKFLSSILVLSAMLSLAACDDDSKDKKKTQTDNNTQSKCEENALQCNDNTPIICHENDWIPLPACGSNQTCDLGVCKDKPNTGGSSEEGDVQDSEDKFCENAKSDYLCDGNDYVVCQYGHVESRVRCANSLGTDYSGNICVDDGEFSHCGCNTDNDCREGFSCDKSYKYCVESTPSEDCNASACKTAEANYQGNICVDHFGVSECGCNTNDDCKEGYSCSNWGYCSAASDNFDNCDASVCKAQTGTEYQGDVCLELADGIGYCGCSNDKECKTGYHCSNWGICNEGEPTGNDCDPESCKAGIGYYAGDICVDYYEDGSFFDCGCYQDSDCSNNTKCMLEEGYKAGYCF